MLLFTVLIMGGASRYKVNLKVDNLRIPECTQPPFLDCMINY